MSGPVSVNAAATTAPSCMNSMFGSQILMPVDTSAAYLLAQQQQQSQQQQQQQQQQHLLQQTTHHPLHASNHQSQQSQPPPPPPQQPQQQQQQQQQPQQQQLQSQQHQVQQSSQHPLQNSISTTSSEGCSLDAQYTVDVHTLRLLMSGKEVGSVIGKKGSNVKRYREESGARINICDASSPERIVTVIGSIQQIQSAFTLMCEKFEEDLQNISMSEDRSTSSGITSTPITLRLLIPGPQCGSIIGKGGSKIKEIRQTTGAAVQVASDILSQSTERIVTVSGSTKSISQCIKIICELLQECPNKVPVIPYKPRPSLGVSVLLPGAMAPTFLSGASHFAPFATDLSKNLVNTSANPFNASAASFQQLYESAAAAAVLAQQANHLPGLPAQAFLSLPLGSSGQQGLATAGQNPLSPLSLYSGLPGGLTFAHPALTGLNPASLGCLPFSLLPTAAGTGMGTSQYTQELIIPNELIGCVIGRGGNKINEIRQASGAQIKISNVESGGNERKIVMSGNVEQVQMAKLLIQRRLSTELLLGSRHLES